MRFAEYTLFFVKTSHFFLSLNIYVVFGLGPQITHKLFLSAKDVTLHENQRSLLCSLFFLASS